MTNGRTPDAELLPASVIVHETPPLPTGEMEPVPVKATAKTDTATEPESEPEPRPALTSEAIGKRRHPREIHEGDPLYRAFSWANTPAWECRYPQPFKGTDAAVRWRLACCKTFWSMERLIEHMAEEHHHDLTEEGP